MELLKIIDFSLKNKRVLIRSDLNVPIKEGVVTSDARIRAALPTIEYALNFGAKVMIASHLGRPEEGVFDDSFSLLPIVNYLKTILKYPIRLVKNWLEIPFSIHSGELVLLENVRFNVGEKENSEALSKRMAAMCDIFVMDAFGAAHRAHASTCGVARFAPSACAGFLMSSEIENLSRALDNPKKPMVAIVGGAKVSTKLSVLQRLSSICDQIIPGGGIANTFLAASGVFVGKSLVEESFIDQARVLLDKIDIPLPIDVIVATSVSENAEITQKSVTEVKSDEMILDIGPETSMLYSKILSQSRTILWNGPVGVFEIDRFSGGTKALAEAVARADVFSIAGGGDTIAALDKFDLKKQISYVSSGGGAFLEFVKGKNLPAIKMLEERSHKR